MTKAPHHTTNPETGAVQPHHIYTSSCICQETLKAGLERNPNPRHSLSADARTALPTSSDHSAQDHARSRYEDEIHRWEDEGGSLGNAVEAFSVLPDANPGLDALDNASRSAQKTNEGPLS